MTRRDLQSWHFLVVSFNPILRAMSFPVAASLSFLFLLLVACCLLFVLCQFCVLSSLLFVCLFVC